MARGFLYVYERIYKGETEMQTEFRKIPVNGKRTSVADQKRVRKIISDNAHRIAQECSVLVSYPKMRIEGTAVNLGDVHIMLPDCRIIDIEELKKIERGGGGKVGRGIFKNYRRMREKIYRRHNHQRRYRSIHQRRWQRRDNIQKVY